LAVNEAHLREVIAENSVHEHIRAAEREKKEYDPPALAETCLPEAGAGIKMLIL
jgi:hypothetical protein